VHPPCRDNEMRRKSDAREGKASDTRKAGRNGLGRQLHAWAQVQEIVSYADREYQNGTGKNAPIETTITQDSVNPRCTDHGRSDEGHENGDEHSRPANTRY